VKLWYLSSCFRRERPQKGRYRQFWQVGAEAVGSDDPAVDARRSCCWPTSCARSGRAGCGLRLSSLGTPASRAEYRAELQDFLRAHEAELSQEVRDRIDLNPLRAFDADHPGTKRVMQSAPRLLDRLAPDDREHFDEVRALLDAAGIAYEIDPTLVRWPRLLHAHVFEFTSDALGAQSGVGGGGRYDGLMEQLGGPPTPGMGWAAGVERILLASGRTPAAEPPVDLYVAYAKPQLRAAAFTLAAQARHAGLATRLELGGRSLKGQLKQADRAGARFVAILGDEGASLKDMESGEQRTVEPEQVMHFSRAEPDVRPPRGEPLPRRVGGRARRRARRRARPRRRLGAPPARPRRADLHRPARPQRAAAARLPPRGRARSARARPARAPRARAERGGRDRPPRAGQGEPAHRDREIELSVHQVDVLAESETPPFAIDEEGPLDETLRLRHRMLDLRRDGMRDAMLVRHAVNRALRDYLNAHDFMEIETPILTRSTPEGARDFLVPARMTPGAFYALPQSPQLFKQLLMMAGYERYYQIARCFRDEDLRADRQPEFTQLDLEMGFVEEDDVIASPRGCCGACSRRRASPPARRRGRAWLRRGDGALRLGPPDVRFGLEISDLGDVLAGSGFKVFAGTLAGGGVVRGLNAGAREVPRSELDALTDHVKRYGAGGLCGRSCRTTARGARRSPSSCRGRDRRGRERLGGAPGDLLLIVADKPLVAATALGELRLELARRFELVPEGRHELLWVVDFPMFEHNEGEGRWDAPAPPVHRAGRRLQRPGALRSRGYDIVLDGSEIGGGLDPYQPPRRPAAGVQSARDLRGGGGARFGFLLEALRYGAPPHGGIALGIDRVVR
jgi:aspartyl-tRNA synthetase